MQIAYLLSFHWDIDSMIASNRVTFDYRIMWWQGNNNYFYLVTMWIILGFIVIVLSVLFPHLGGRKGDKAAKEHKRHLTRREKKSYTHLMTEHEAKKGLQRFEFDIDGNNSDMFREKRYKNSWYVYGGLAIICVQTALSIGIIWNISLILIHLFKPDFGNQSPILFLVIFVTEFAVLFFLFGYLCNFHFRDYLDLIFNPFKHLWNKICTKLKLADTWKMNELSYLYVGQNNQTCRRAGLPVISRKGKIWLIATDDHDLTIGTTNSGKTFTIIHIMIELHRMGGGSVFINDIKGDLTRDHINRFIDDGYNIIKLDFIHPEESVGWNPFGLAVTKYRLAQQQAEDDFLNSFEHMNERFYWKYLLYDKKKEFLQAIQDTLGAYRDLQNQEASESSFIEVTNRLHKVRDEYYGWLDKNNVTQPNFSEAQENIDDYCRILCEDKDPRNGHFRDQAASLMAGIIYFLLEYEYLNEDGHICQLGEEHITFENINRVKDEALQLKNIDSNKKQVYLMKWFIDHTKRTTDMSVEKTKSIFTVGENERGSIFSTFQNKMKLGLISENARKITAKTTFDWNEVFNRKTVIFMSVNDEKSTFHQFVSLFVSQLYYEAVAKAREEGEKGGKEELKIPWDIIWDEFGVSPPVKDLDKFLATSRSRKIRWHLVVQEYAQIIENYGRDALSIIKNNIGTTIYLLASNENTLKEVSTAAGKTLVWNKERGAYDTVPLLTEERLSKSWSQGEVLFLRQRRNPFVTRMLGWNAYNFRRTDKDVAARVAEMEKREGGLEYKKRFVARGFAVKFSLEDEYERLVKRGKVHESIAFESGVSMESNVNSEHIKTESMPSNDESEPNEISDDPSVTAADPELLGGDSTKRQHKQSAKRPKVEKKNVQRKQNNGETNTQMQESKGSSEELKSIKRSNGHDIYKKLTH